MTTWRIVTDPRGLLGGPWRDQVEADSPRAAFIAARMNRGGSREAAEQAWRNFERNGLHDSYLGEDGQLALVILLDPDTQDPLYIINRWEV